SFLAFANDNYGEDLYGKCNLWLCSSRIKIEGMMDFNANNGFRILKFQLVHGGHPVPYSIETTPYEITLKSKYGEVAFVIAETKLVLAKGKGDAALRMSIPKPMSFFNLDATPVPAPAPLASTVFDFRTSKVQAAPLKGTLVQNADYTELRPANGELLIAFEDFFKGEPKVRASYPTYAEGLASVTADFDEYVEQICPKLPAEFEPQRLQALWQNWQMTVTPDGESAYKRRMVKMIHSIFEGAFVWQQPLQAIVHAKTPAIAWDIFCSAFEHMSEDGKLTDSLTFEDVPSFGLKPPVHGIALLELMKLIDVTQFEQKEKEWVWEGLKKWTDFWFTTHDTDGDGVAEFANILETGWEDSPSFNVGFPNASPDLNALLVLQMEALAKFGRLIGKDEAVLAKLEADAKVLTGKIVEKFWNGTEWFAYNAKTGDKSDSHTISLFFPLLLGDRLPKEVVDKSIEFMFAKGGFDTPYGLATETLDSDYFFHGFTQGSVITPSSFWLAIALEACGRADLAKKVSRAYCAMQRDTGFFHIHNALTGKEDRSLTAFGEKGLFWSAWSSGTYIYLAGKYGN
ncbi:MAG: hypothetical protein LBM98_10955, partial [Oscillospiraceae bacterium]|nr:hypothetical protein [Oscillospiraceae bacterium]